MKWHTIDTAPKDGTEIIGVYYRPADDLFSATSYGPWTVAWDGRKWRASWGRRRVVSDFGISYKSPDIDPTHWQPMPSVDV